MEEEGLQIWKNGESKGQIYDKVSAADFSRRKSGTSVLLQRQDEMCGC